MRHRTPIVTLAVALALAVLSVTLPARDQQALPDASGTIRTVSASGAIDHRNKFFQPVGKQFAITCEHCHFEADAWSVTPEHARQLFTSTRGRHPLFTAPSANDFHAALALRPNTAVPDRQAAFSLLLDKGLVLVRRNFDGV